MHSFDNVFRTLLNDCSSLIIPVINEVFGEKYTGKEQVVFSPDTHFLNRQDGQGELEGDTLTVGIPHSAVLFLRCSRKTPDRMRIVMETPGGTVRFHVPVMKAQKYSIEEIFEKNLLFHRQGYPYHLSGFSSWKQYPEIYHHTLNFCCSCTSLSAHHLQ